MLTGIALVVLINLSVSILLINSICSAKNALQKRYNNVDEKEVYNTNYCSVDDVENQLKMKLMESFSSILKKHLF